MVSKHNKLASDFSQFAYAVNEEIVSYQDKLQKGRKLYTPMALDLGKKKIALKKLQKKVATLEASLKDKSTALTNEKDKCKSLQTQDDFRRY